MRDVRINICGREGRERGSLLPRNQIIKEKVKTISEPEFWFLKFSWNHLRYAHKIPLSLTLRNTAKIIFWDKKKFHDSQTTKEMQVLFSRTVRGHREIFSSERWSGNILEILSVRITESWGGWPPGKLSASWSRNWAAYRHSFSCLATTSSQVKQSGFPRTHFSLSCEMGLKYWVVSHNSSEKSETIRRGGEYRSCQGLT